MTSETPADGPRVASKDDLRATRTAVVVAPSGHAYRIRPLNLERHALSGSLPGRLRQVALRGADAVDELFRTDDENQMSEHGREVRTYLDGLVLQVIVEPELTQADLDQDLLPPVDYRWAVGIAMGEIDRDGEGNRIWGREALSRWERFRDQPGVATDRGGGGGDGAQLPAAQPM